MLDFRFKRGCGAGVTESKVALTGKQSWVQFWQLYALAIEELKSKWHRARKSRTSPAQGTRKKKVEISDSP